MIFLIYSYHGSDCDQTCPGLEDEGGEVFECSGYGECKEHEGEWRCKCDSYATGAACDIVCPNSGYDEEKEKNIVCSGHGECNIESNTSATCECKDGYYGEGCDVFCPGTTFDDDSVVECSDHGTCKYSEEDQSAECKCSDGFFGESCERECPGKVTIDDKEYACNGHGTCDDGFCTCNEGYYGETCESSCPGLLTINNKVFECNGHGNCDPNSLQCTCFDVLYSGDACMFIHFYQSHVGECTENTCGKHGHCNDEMKCECDEM